MVTIGLDLGQKRDHTAIVVVERPQAHAYLTQPERRLYVRSAERLPLGLSYSEMVEVVRHVTTFANGKVMHRDRCRLVVLTSDENLH